MLPKINLPQAINRGRFQRAIADIYHRGIPFDPLFRKFKDNWLTYKLELIAEVDHAYGVFDNGTLKQLLLRKYLAKEGLVELWPRTDSGKLLKTDVETFQDMAKRHHQLGDLKELVWTIKDMKKLEVEMKPDGRHRASSFPFGTTTGRNAPKKESIFGKPVWMRSFWMPTEGSAFAYIDWTAAEVGIAAALSGDRAMMDMYLSGDPHLSFAKMAEAVPPWATKETHRKSAHCSRCARLPFSMGRAPKAWPRR